MSAARSASSSSISTSDLQQLRWRLALYDRMNQDMRDRLLAPWKERLHSLSSFENRHRGRRCFVVGNGPSLNRIDMRLLRDELTLGSNRVYLGFERWGFGFNYWAVQDETQIMQSADEYADRVPRETIKFIPSVFLHRMPLARMENVCSVPLELHPTPYPQFSNAVERQFSGWTVTYLLLQLAVIMGCDPIVIVGMDYNYNIGEKEQVAPGRWRDPLSKSHFHPDYANVSKDHVWNMPRFDFMDPAFAFAARWARENRVRIVNATPGSKLDFFEKVEFASLFA